MFASKDVFLTPPSTGGYTIARSVRLRSSASAYFNRTLTTPTNNTTWTISAWVKRGSLGVAQTLFGAAQQSIEWVAGNGISIYSAGNPVATSTAVYRDPSAWYHFVINSNGTTVTVYANNQSVLTYTGTLTSINSAISHTIGKYANSSADYLDGYITEINFIDGQALTPSSFGSTNAITGVWQPAKYTGTYGTNGFYLNFSDNSNNTAATIGKDYSGNGNNWTPNNISVTAGATYDSMTDVPTLTSATVSNYCVINPLDFTNTKPTITNGNLQYANSSNSLCRGTLGVLNAKVYWEFTQVSTVDSGNPMSYGTAGLIGKLAHDSSAQSVMAYTDNGVGKIFERTTASGVAATVTPASFTVNVGDIIQIAYDGTNGKIWIGKNNSWYDSSGTQTGNPSAGTNAVFTLPDLTNPMTAGFDHAGAPYTVAVNFGQQPFTYTPPTGFVALNTYNL